MKQVIFYSILLSLIPLNVFCQKEDSQVSQYKLYPFPSKIKRSTEYLIPLKSPESSMKVFLLNNGIKQDITNFTFARVKIPIDKIKSLNPDSEFSLEIRNPGPRASIFHNGKVHKDISQEIDGIVFNIPLSETNRLKNAEIFLISDIYSNNKIFFSKSEQIENFQPSEPLQIVITLPDKTPAKSGYQIVVESKDLVQSSNPLQVQRKTPLIVQIVGLPVAGILLMLFEMIIINLVFM
jgi:hypothetical protein